MKRKHRVAVYGTLKKSKHNHDLLLDRSDYIGEGELNGDYTLVVKGLPYVVERPGNGVECQIFAVDDVVLASLDRLEGHPNFYERKMVPVTFEDGVIEDIYCYVHPDVFDDNVETRRSY